MRAKRKAQSSPIRLIFILMSIVLISGIWFMFLRTSGESIEVVKGKWLRTDGNYTIEISTVGEDGILIAKYFNPGPIHVGRSGWRVKDDKIQIFIELQDENYPGSLYELFYDEEKNQLTGSYYQAVARQSYDVIFKRK